LFDLGPFALDGVLDAAPRGESTQSVF